MNKKFLVLLIILVALFWPAKDVHKPFITSPSRYDNPTIFKQDGFYANECREEIYLTYYLSQFFRVIIRNTPNEICSNQDSFHISFWPIPYSLDMDSFWIFYLY